MDFRPTLQGLVDNVLFWLLTIGAGAVFAFLKAKGFRVTEPLLYGLSAFALMAVIFVAVRAQSQLRVGSPITPQNIEVAVRRWADDFGYGIQRAQNDEGVFALTLTLPGKANIIVVQPKAIDRYLEIAVNVVLSDQHRKRFDGMPPAAQEDVVRGVRMELARLPGMEWAADNKLTRVSIVRHIPITAQLTEYEFVHNVMQVNGARVFVIEYLRTRLVEAAP